MSHVAANDHFGTYENTIGQVGRLVLEIDGSNCTLYPIAVFAQLCYSSPETIRRHIDEGKLIGVKVGSRWFVQIGKPVVVESALDELPF